MKTKIAFVYNPKSGSGTSQKYLHIFQALVAERFEVCSFCTEKNRVVEQAIEICKKGYNRIIICGGDGTINEVINGIMTSGTSPIIAIIPMGTGNDLARSLGHYKRFKIDSYKYIADLVNVIENNDYKKIRILSANNDLFFTNYLGIGFDANVIKEFQQKRESVLPNKVLYSFIILKNLFVYISERLKISLPDKGDNKKEIYVKGFKNILITNIPSYGGGVLKFDSVKLQGGFFNIIIIKCIREFVFFALYKHLQIFITKVFGKWKPEIFKTEEVQLDLYDNPIIQIDGEDFSDRFFSKNKIIVKTAGYLNIIS